jgi:hypothetical protein
LEEAVVDEFMQLSLRECSLSALAIMRFAASVAGIVVIVTLAREGWLESLIARFAPELDGELEKLGVRVVYARDCAVEQSPSMVAVHPGSENHVKKKADWSNDAHVRAKGIAIARECEAFFAASPGHNWNNIVAIGDAQYEILGSQIAVQKWARKNRRVALQLPRLKTIRLISEPTCKELIAQLDVLERLLMTIISTDQAISINMETIRTEISYDNALNLLHIAERSLAEPISDALIAGVLWKLCEGSSPSNPDRWRQRRVWLSKSGRLWYESLKDVQPKVFFQGLTFADISATSLGNIGGESDAVRDKCASVQIGEQFLYAMRFQVLSEKSTSAWKIFAAESHRDRRKWISLCRSFRSSNK